MTINIEKHCRLDREPSDGRRILVTRFWPRRMARDRIDAWYKDLGPSIDLFRRFKALANTTGLTERARAKQHHLLMEEYRTEVREQLDLLSEIRGRYRSGEAITLLCVCHDPAKCHRSVLAEVILEEEV